MVKKKIGMKGFGDGVIGRREGRCGKRIRIKTRRSFLSLNVHFFTFSRALKTVVLSSEGTHFLE